MRKTPYMAAILVSVGALGLSACAPVPFENCNKCTTCWHKPPPKPKATPLPKKPVVVEKIVEIRKPVTIRGVNFHTDSDVLIGNDLPILDNVAEYAHKHPEVTLRIYGYCSKTGTYEYNLDLSRRRAASVANYLASRGVPRKGMVTKGFSWLHPVATNATAHGRFLNQRVVVHFTITEKKVIRQ